MPNDVHSDHHKVVRQYAHHVRWYDRRFAEYLDATLGVALDMMALTGTERILDVACGTGELERRIVEQFPHQYIRGVDLSDHMLAVAEQKVGRFPNVQLEKADSRTLPFPDAHFDIVVSCSAFHYMREPQRVINEFARVTAPGGRVIVLDWCRDFLMAKCYHLFRRVFFPAHYNVYGLTQMQALMQTAGLTPTQHRLFSVIGFWKMMCVEARKS